MRRLENDGGIASETEYYSSTINERCGLVIARENGQRILWVTAQGQLKRFQCANLDELLRTISREEIVESFRANWSPRNDETFEQMWDVLLADITQKCGSWDLLERIVVPERVKRQLMWAFDASGRLDGDWFLTILSHERVALTPLEMVELASELTQRPWRRLFLSQN